MPVSLVGFTVICFFRSCCSLVEPCFLSLWTLLQKVKVLVVQLCLTLGDLMDCSPPGSFVHGILRARILEWAAISFSRVSSRSRDQTQTSLNEGRLFTSESPGSFVHGILQARILEWAAISFQIQGSNPDLLQCRQILYFWITREAPKMLEWVAISFSMGSSSPHCRGGRN